MTDWRYYASWLGLSILVGFLGLVIAGVPAVGWAMFIGTLMICVGIKVLDEL